MRLSFPDVLFVLSLVLLVGAAIHYRLSVLARLAIPPRQATTKLCPDCGCDCMVPLRSMNLKICPDCKAETPWTLSEGQVPLMAPSRDTRKPKE